MTETIRMIKRISDGAIKRVRSGAAARLVAKGGYEYVDGGIDESKTILEQKNQRYEAITKRNSDIINITNIPKVERIFIDPKNKQPQKQVQSQVQSQVQPQESKPAIQPIRKQKTIRKKADIPQDRLEQIRKINIGSPQLAIISPEKSTDSLKTTIEKARRTKTGKPQKKYLIEGKQLHEI